MSRVSLAVTEVVYKVYSGSIYEIDTSMNAKIFIQNLKNENGIQKWEYCVRKKQRMEYIYI